MWYVNGETDKRNPYGQALENLVLEVLRVLNAHDWNEEFGGYTARDWHYKIAVLFMPQVGEVPAHLRVARIVDNNNDLMKCVMALNGTPLTGHILEHTCVGIPLIWVDDSPAA